MSVTGASPKRTRIQEELVPSGGKNKTQTNSTGTDDAAVFNGRARGRDDVERGRGRNRPKPPAPPAAETPTVPPADNSAIKSLAERYVDQYTKNSGATLSTEERTARISEVTEFYSDPSRAGRLEKIVFA